MATNFAITWVVLLLAAGHAHCDEPRRVVEYAGEFDGAAVDLFHQPLDSRRLEWWVEVLRASDAQVHFMMLMHEQFVERHNAMLDREAPRCFIVSLESTEVANTEGYATTAYLRKTQEYNRAVASLRQMLVAQEHEFIDSIQPVLTAEQLEQVIVLRNDTIRRNWRTSDNFVRWIEVELREIWMESEAIDLATPEERKVVHEILLDFEMQLTPLIRNHARARPRTDERIITAMIARAQNRLTAHEQMDQIRRFQSNRVADATRIRTLHESTLEHIALTLSDHAAAAFIDDVKRVAFPELYPDPASLHAVFAAVLDENNNSIDDESRSLVAARRDQYRSEYNILSRQLESFCSSWGERNLQGLDGYQRQFFPEALKPLLEERRALSRQWLATLREDLGADVLEAHIDLIPAGLAEVAETDSPTATPEPEPDR